MSLAMGLFCACGNGLELDADAGISPRATLEVRKMWQRLHSKPGCKPCTKAEAQRVERELERLETTAGDEEMMEFDSVDEAIAWLTDDKQ